tara:strand:- start:5093 stop:5338 length:246 start_codon:yes stop_codon:yes gene_type:complete
MTKVDEQELKTINELVKNHNNLLLRLGDIDFKTNKLKQQRKNIIKSIDKILQQRDDIIQKMTEKYGPGALNIDTGEFNLTK